MEGGSSRNRSAAAAHAGPDAVAPATSQSPAQLPLPTEAAAPHPRFPSGMLAAKLSAPELTPSPVVRRRLHDQLSEGAARRATLVSNGPGWGRTVLVAN
jgi:hypothetical protein